MEPALILIELGSESSLWARVLVVLLCTINSHIGCIKDVSLAWKEKTHPFEALLESLLLASVSEQ